MTGSFGFGDMILNSNKFILRASRRCFSKELRYLLSIVNFGEEEVDRDLNKLVESTRIGIIFTRPLPKNNQEVYVTNPVFSF